MTAVATDDPARNLSGAGEALASHLLVFAAEEARVSGSVIDVELFQARVKAAADLRVGVDSGVSTR